MGTDWGSTLAQISSDDFAVASTWVAGGWYGFPEFTFIPQKIVRFETSILFSDFAKNKN